MIVILSNKLDLKQETHFTTGGGKTEGSVPHRVIDIDVEVFCSNRWIQLRENEDFLLSALLHRNLDDSGDAQVVQADADVASACKFTRVTINKTSYNEHMILMMQESS